MYNILPILPVVGILQIRIVGFRSSHPKVFKGKGVLIICSKFTGEHPSRSAISIELFCNNVAIKLFQYI